MELDRVGMPAAAVLLLQWNEAMPAARLRPVALVNACLLQKA